MARPEELHMVLVGMDLAGRTVEEERPRSTLRSRRGCRLDRHRNAPGEAVAGSREERLEVRPEVRC